MAHYAILDENNIVIQVIVGKDENEQLPEGYNSWEEYYGGVKTSYNTFQGEHLLGGIPFRKNYAAIGYFYDSNRDAFIPPKIFNSWTLNEETCQWEAPIPMPEHTINERYIWSEADQIWYQTI